MLNPNFEIRLWDLPKDKIYIIIEENLRKKLFQEAVSSIGSKKKLKKFLNREVNQFIKGKRRTSLVVVDLISNLIVSNESEKEKLWKSIEENTVEIRCGGISGTVRAFSIFKPRFPIKLTPEFANFLGHIVGDGSISQGKSMYGTVSYYNNERYLIENFIKKVRYIFGDSEYREDKKRENYSVYFSKLLGIILEEIIGDLSSFREKISSLMLLVEDKSIITAFLRALYDDEGHVSFKKKSWTREIVLNMKNNSVMECTHELLSRVDISPNPIREIKYVEMGKKFREKFFDEAWDNGILQKLKISKRRYLEYRNGRKGRFKILPTIVLVKKICRQLEFNFDGVLEKSNLKSMYVFGVSSQENLKRFGSLIGFDHPQKRADMNELLDSYQFDNVEFKKKLLELLRGSENTAPKIAKELDYETYYVRARLKELEDEGKVICVKNKGHDDKGCFIPYTWRIDQGSN